LRDGLITGDLSSEALLQALELAEGEVGSVEEVGDFIETSSETSKFKELFCCCSEEEFRLVCEFLLR